MATWDMRDQMNQSSATLPQDEDEIVTTEMQLEIENYIKKYPDQYFWFHRRWKTRPS